MFMRKLQKTTTSDTKIIKISALKMHYKQQNKY